MYGLKIKLGLFTSQRSMVKAKVCTALVSLFVKDIDY